ncbi:histidine-containing phosphotransfer protein 2-like [Coffea arabica]|uniref:Histidine-containing phosphotransfer protein n=1 Tax=Coffea arabica TaxID=13443 RepID=A0ABM4WA52_COFAR
MNFKRINEGFRHGQLLQMIDEGYINLDFCGIMRDASATDPSSVVQIIHIYCAEMESLLFRLNRMTKDGSADLAVVTELSRTAKLKSERIGAERVLLECSNLVQACENKDIDNIHEALFYVKNEFKYTKTKLLDFAKLQKRIVNLENEEKKK